MVEVDSDDPGGYRGVASVDASKVYAENCGMERM